jgi:Mycotoxin biosynthesis protein UstYa
LIVGLVAFDEDKLPLLNKSKTANWRKAKDGQILASLEVFHDLHCLNFIRQYTYRNEYDYSDNIAFGGGDEMIREVRFDVASNRTTTYLIMGGSTLTIVSRVSVSRSNVHLM